MGYLLLQIFLSLLAALLIGVVATWYFQRAATRRREEIIQTDYRSRLRQVE
ncbi:MAG: hypothetical protein HKM98_02940, partial [Gammaproteobacteria bacterium]|nr:hypothetical protein [Gammaproteobacteria bacterium]